MRFLRLKNEEREREGEGVTGEVIESWGEMIHCGGYG
jgi:hypothetical protein